MAHLSILNVLGDSSGEQCSSRLFDDSKHAEDVGGDVCVHGLRTGNHYVLVLAVEDVSRAWVVQSAKQSCHRALARAGLTDETGNGPRFNPQRDFVQDEVVSRLVPKGDAVQLDVCGLSRERPTAAGD
jgi:hypothetical protein